MIVSKLKRILGAAFIAALCALPAAAVHAQTAPSTPSASTPVASGPDACTPQLYADLAPDAVYIDVTRPLPASIDVKSHRRMVVILLARPYPVVGSDVTATIKSTDSDTSPLFTMVNQQVEAKLLCKFIVAQWTVNRAGTGELTLTSTPVVPNAKPEVITIPVVTH